MGGGFFFTMMHCRVTQTNSLFLWQLVYQYHPIIALVALDILLDKVHFFLRTLYFETMEYIPKRPLARMSHVGIWITYSI